LDQIRRVRELVWFVSAWPLGDAWQLRINRELRNGEQKLMRDKATRNNAGVGDETVLAHAMLDYVGDAVLATDATAHITYMNAAAETLTGMFPRLST